MPALAFFQTALPGIVFILVGVSLVLRFAPWAPRLLEALNRRFPETEGFVKILADAKTDRVLCCHIIGPYAGTLIHEVVLAMEFGGSAEDIARTYHGHPTLNEAVKEAALGVAGRAIHI